MTSHENEIRIILTPFVILWRPCYIRVHASYFVYTASKMTATECSIMHTMCLYVLDDKIDVLAALGRRGVGPLIEERCRCTPFESPSGAGWTLSAEYCLVTSHKAYRTSSLGRCLEPPTSEDRPQWSCQWYLSGH